MRAEVACGGIIVAVAIGWMAIFYHLGIQHGQRRGFRAGYEVGSSQAWRTCAESITRWRADAKTIIKPH